MSAKTITCIGAVFSGFFIQGFCDIVGITSDYASERYGLNQTLAGLLPLLVFIWFLFISIPIGVKMNKIGRKPMVLIGMSVTMVGMFVPLVNSWWACLIGYALLGIGNAVMQVSQNVLLCNVLHGGRLLPSAVTAGQVVKAVSSFCGPLFVLLAIRMLGDGTKMSWYMVFPFLGAMTLVSGLWLLLSPVSKEPQSEHTSSIKTTLSMLRNPKMLMLFFAIFFVVATDVGTNFVSSKILIERYGWAVTDAGLAQQVYFVSRTVGALLGVLMLAKIAPFKYFKINVVGCVLSLFVLSYFRFSSTSTLVLIGAVGFFCSCIWPVIFCTAIDLQPNRENEVAGLMITAVAGGGIITPLLGWTADTLGTITSGMGILVIAALYLLWCAFAYGSSREYYFYSKEQKRIEE